MLNAIYKELKSIGFVQNKVDIHHKRLGINKSFDLDKYHLEVYKGGTRYNNWIQLLVYGGKFTHSLNMPNTCFDLMSYAKDVVPMIKEIRMELVMDGLILPENRNELKGWNTAHKDFNYELDINKIDPFNILKSIKSNTTDTKNKLGDFDIWYKPCEKCGYDAGKSTKPKEGNKTCWKCGGFIQRDYSDRALKT